MATGSALPRFVARDMQDPGALAGKLNTLVRTLELRLSSLEAPIVDPRDPAAGQEFYNVTNAGEVRTLDAATATTADVANVLGTFLTDLANEDKLR